MKQIKNIIIDNLLSNNQEIVSTTSDHNGYPKNEKPAVVGFADWAEAMQAQEEHGGYLMTLQRRYGQQLWSRMGAAVEECRDEDGNRVMSCDEDSCEYTIGLVDYADPDKESEYRVEDTETGNAVFYEGTSALEAVKAALEAMDGEDGFEEVDVYKDDELVFCGATDSKGDLFGLLTTQETVGDNITAIRTAAHMSQSALADKTGLRQATISDIESGRTDPKLSTLTAIAAALGCDLTDLFE